jgi:hypothetical protein
MSATLTVTVLLVVAGAAPAYAHTVAGVGADNYQTRLTGFSPRIDGLTVRVIENGSRLELSNTGSTEVVVFGYQEEPYLRIGPEGVFANRRSPATYVNASRKGDPVPPDADPKQPPEWRRQSTGRTARWHDHRIHWMLDTRPPAVAAAPGRQHLSASWTVGGVAGTTPLTISGTLRWVPGPAPWTAAGPILLPVVFVLYALRSPRRDELLAGALVALVAIDVVHQAGIAAVNAGPWTTKLGYLVTTSAVSLVAWVVAVLALREFRARNRAAIYLAAFSGVAIAIGGGLFDLATLTASTPPFALPAVIARAAVGLSLGFGVGFALAAVREAWQSRSRPGAPGGEPATPVAPAEAVEPA